MTDDSEKIRLRYRKSLTETTQAQAVYAKQYIEVLESELEQAKEKLSRLENNELGFYEVVDILRKWIKWYPANTIVCSNHSDASYGAKFVYAIREALKLLPEKSE